MRKKTEKHARGAAAGVGANELSSREHGVAEEVEGQQAYLEIADDEDGRESGRKE